MYRTIQSDRNEQGKKLHVELERRFYATACINDFSCAFFSSNHACMAGPLQRIELA